MLLAPQLTAFYKDISDKDMKSAMTMLHLRFSTNTFPTWDLAHPFRMIAHNGEINTLRGNKNWMRGKGSRDGVSVLRQGPEANAAGNYGWPERFRDVRFCP